MTSAPKRETTVERIERYAQLQDGWEDGHRGISADVASTARELAERVGPSLLAASPFDGAISLARRWPRHARPYGREVEIKPDGLMDLVADHPYETGTDDDYDQALDLDKAAAWLIEDTRTAARPATS